MLVGLIYFWLQYTKAERKAATLAHDLGHQKEQYESRIGQIEKRASALETENQHLAKWRVVADADTKAAEFMAAARAVVEKAQADAARLVAEGQQQAAATLELARTESESTTSGAKERAKALEDSARASLDASTAKAAQIVADANKRAEEIAGDAYKAMNKADLYEKTVRAMRNIIEGYGDEYLIPTRSLLDGLAKDFGHTEAGQALKSARDRSDAMVKNRTAATCKYVEEGRRETAIEFVMDAFNGKVDSILSRVKHDNVGKLAQEIRDAFTMVNFNGRAFRECQITEEYLAARLDELKWAVVAQKLKLDEREEQRRIKEQIREEDKARREYERAIKEAERDEEALRKAMQKAEQMVQEATEEQRAKYEAQVTELTAKLKEAEELSQRAKSMAEQTKRGHVYIISNIGSFGEHVYKIGLTRRLEPLDRIRELGDSSVPFEFDVHALMYSEDAPALEAKLHNHFLMTQMNKVNYRKEFFKVDLAHIREEVTKLGIDAKWTMAAEAQEYRETLAIEAAIGHDPAKLEAWANGLLEVAPPAMFSPEETEDEARPTPAKASG
ncbi:MAG: DUF4041 domain-containing protein [Planctomycetes bacterium]|nr:DUF4041 domain-containing protein [Planctomycetota bacterium]